MKYLKNRSVILIAIGLLSLISSCVYYYIDQEGCAYCEELKTHFTTAPMCEGNAAEKRAWIDSIQVQGNRNGQNWLCEIR